MISDADHVERLISSKWVERFISFILVIVIFLLDSLLNLDVAIAVLYVVVILIAANNFSRREVFSVTIACVMLTFTAFVIDHGDDFVSDAFGRCIVSISAILITGWLAIQRKAVSDDLREQVRLLAQTHDAVIICNLDRTVKVWNRGAEALYGWKKQEVLGHNCVTLLDPQPAPDSEQNLQQAREQLEAAGYWEGELTEKRKDGSEVIVACRLSLHCNEYGKPIAIFSSNNDITKQKLAHQALRRSEAFLASAQRLSQTGSIGISYPAETMTWSDEALRIFDFAASPTPSVQDCIRRVHPDDNKQAENILAKCRQETPLVSGKLRLLMDDKSVKYIKLVLQRNTYSPQCYEYTGAVMDITTATEAEDALHHSQMELAHVSRMTMLGELMASFAHELNQPLASISANGEASLRWINRPTPDLDEVIASIQRVIRDANRASDIIKHIRALVSKEQYRHQLFDINTLVTDTLSLLERELNHYQIKTELLLCNQPVVVSGNKVQLQQVILNLLINGMQAMTEVAAAQRTITLKTHLDGQWMTLHVMDNGPGFDELTKEKLFQPFYTSKTDGMGMGLSICRSIVENHGGRIVAENQPTGGAEFTILLPHRLIDNQELTV